MENEIKLNKVNNATEIDNINREIFCDDIVNKKNPFFIKPYKRFKLNKMDKIALEQTRDEILKNITELSTILSSRLTNKQRIDALKKESRKIFLKLKHSYK